MARFPTGANQGAPSSASNQSSTIAPTVTISSATNSLVIDCLASSRTTSAVGAGQTQQVADDVAGSIPVVRMSSEAGAASVEMSWTLTIDNNDWGLVAVSIAPDAVPFHRLRLRGIGGGIGRGM